MNATDGAPILEATELGVSRGGTSIFSNVSLTVAAGDRFLIHGPSGSGKTTLFRTFGLLTQPDQGELLIAGDSVGTLSERARARVRGSTIGLVFQDFQLIPDLTAWENARLPQEHRHVDSPGPEWLREIFAELGLNDLRDQYPRSLSGGEKQRVAAARALANKPHLILADEPTGQLDPDTSETLLELLFGLQTDTATDAALGVVSHDRSLRNRFESIYLLQNGTLSAEPPADSVPRASTTNR